MRRYILIGTGGFGGAILRFLMKRMEGLHIFNQLHLNTMIINMTGCFVLAVFLRLVLDKWEIDTDWRLGIATGFLGAFTTFSTLCRETVSLMLAGRLYIALLYMLLSVAIGLIAVILGDMAGKKVVRIVELR